MKKVIFITLVVLAIVGTLVDNIDSETEKKTVKTTVVLPKHRMQKSSLAPKKGNKIVIYVKNPKLTRKQAKALIDKYRNLAGQEGQVVVYKPSNLMKGRMTSWAVDNIDNKGIFFNDNLFHE